MKVVIDTNIIIASLLKDSTVREILTSKQVEFFVPEYAFEEINNHIELISKKSGLNKKEITEVTSIIMENIKTVKFETIKNKMREARKIMKEIDEKDSPFIAAALAIKADGIWTFDKDFLKQKRIRVISTRELYNKVI